MRIYVSNGNSKLGTIPSISLPPVKSCGSVKCIDKCYALNICKRFKHVRTQWEENLKYYKYSTKYPFPGTYFGDLLLWLVEYTPTHFRFHVGGDCPDEEYLTNVYKIAELAYDTKFMMFTKRYSWINPKRIPDNLNVLLSMWPYMENPPNEGLARTWVRGDLLTPTDIFKCKGQCQDCYQCWDKGTKDILLKGH